jgi:type II secretory pathway component PulF
LIIRVKDLNKDIVVFNKNIKIKKNVTVAVGGFFEKYWQWLMTTIIIPIFIYFWNRKKKKERKKS